MNYTDSLLLLELGRQHRADLLREAADDRLARAAAAARNRAGTPRRARWVPALLRAGGAAAAG